MLGVGDAVVDHVLQEDFEDSSGDLLVDQTAYTLHTASVSQTTNRKFGGALVVVSEEGREIIPT